MDLVSCTFATRTTSSTVKLFCCLFYLNISKKKCRGIIRLSGKDFLKYNEYHFPHVEVNPLNSIVCSGFVPDSL